MSKGGGAPILTAREIDRAMELVTTSSMSLDTIGSMWLVSGEAIAYHMKRRGITRDKSVTQVRRFWNRVDNLAADADDCWPWMGARLKGRMAYGQVRFRGEVWYAHRLAYTLANGLVPDGLLVLHHCDNPPCCNPEHLFAGTTGDNARDRHAKGRSRGWFQDRETTTDAGWAPGELMEAWGK